MSTSASTDRPRVSTARRPAPAGRRAGRPVSRHRRGYRWIAVAAGVLIVLMTYFPIIFVVSNSLKTGNNIFTNGVFSLFTLWLPELFPTAQRALGAGFAFSLGRVFGAIGPTLVGLAVVVTGSYPLAIAVMSVIYLVGLPAIALAPETAGKPLPA